MTSWRFYLLSLIFSLHVREYFGYYRFPMRIHGSAAVVSRCLTNGICIHSDACPWDRLMKDNMDCMNQHNNFVCCEVSKVRIPVDLFTAYYDW